MSKQEPALSHGSSTVCHSLSDLEMKREQARAVQKASRRQRRGLKDWQDQEKREDVFLGCYAQASGKRRWSRTAYQGTELSQDHAEGVRGGEGGGR